MKNSLYALITAIILLNSAQAVIAFDINPARTEPEKQKTSIEQPWPMFGQNPQRTGRSNASNSIDNPVIKWKFPFGGSYDPVIGYGENPGSDETIYMVSRFILYAISVDGKEKWRFNVVDELKSTAIGPDGTIYIGCNNSMLYAIYPNGTLKWSLDTGGDCGLFPAISSDGTIYIGGVNILHSICSNGTKNWDMQINNVYISSPAIGQDGTLYFTTASGTGSPDNKLYAIYPNKTIKWEYSNGGISVYYYPPTVGPDGTIYISTDTGRIYAINPNGTEKWKFAGFGWHSTIDFNGTIYGSGGTRMYAIYPNGTEKWKFDASNFAHYAAICGLNESIYIFSWGDGKLYSLYPNGTVKWDIYIATTSLYQVIGSDGTVYVGGEGLLYAIGNLKIPEMVFSIVLIPLTILAIFIIVKTRKKTENRRDF
jgi:outer membrane protein assembly factor BamB